MYTLVVSYHNKKPLIANTFQLSKLRLIEEGLLGFKCFELTKGDKEHCIKAWEIIQTACEKQYKYHNLN